MKIINLVGAFCFVFASNTYAGCSSSPNIYGGQDTPDFDGSYS